MGKFMNYQVIYTHKKNILSDSKNLFQFMLFNTKLEVKSQKSEVIAIFGLLASNLLKKL